MDVVKSADDPQCSLSDSGSEDGALGQKAGDRVVDVCDRSADQEFARIRSAAGLSLGLVADSLCRRSDIFDDERERPDPLVAARGGDRAAARVPEDDEKLYMQPVARELQAAPSVDVRDVPRHPDDIEVADAAIEQELDRHPRIRARQHGGERRLVGSSGAQSVEGERVRMLARTVAESLVAELQPALGFVGVDGRDPGIDGPLGPCCGDQ